MTSYPRWFRRMTRERRPWSFINEVANFLLPEKFKIPDVPSYTGFEDPIEHLENF
jgi:hypothetical protein